MAKDGSTPTACRAATVIEVVEVLPWVPARSTWVRPAINSARRSERRIIGMPASVAATSSGLSCAIAAKEVTTTLGGWEPSSILLASWPMAMVAPMARSISTGVDSLISEPVTCAPRLSRIRAKPDIPEPPMPTICTRSSKSALSVGSGSASQPKSPAIRAAIRSAELRLRWAATA